MKNSISMMQLLMKMLMMFSMMLSTTSPIFTIVMKVWPGSGAEFHDGPISYDHDDPRNDFQDAGDDITYEAEVDVINDCDEEAIYDELPDEFRRSMFICHDEIIYTQTL